jgi:hypothetical protein
MCGAKGDVRFAPNSDRKSEHRQNAMSALPPKADVCGATADVCYGPEADIHASINNFIRTCMQRCRNIYLQALRGFEIDDELESRWLDDRKISRLVTL